MKGLIAGMCLAGSLVLGGQVMGDVINGGFETTDGWGYAAGDGTGVTPYADAVRTGELGLIAWTDQWRTDISYATAAQAVGVTGGVEYIFSAWQKSVTDFAHFSMQIDWYDAGSEKLSTSLTNFTDTANHDWEFRSMTAVAPDAATSAMVTLVAVLHPWASRTLYIDDVSFTAVPEPMSVAILAMGCVGLLRRR